VEKAPASGATPTLESGIKYGEGVPHPAALTEMRRETKKSFAHVTKDHKTLPASSTLSQDGRCWRIFVEHLNRDFIVVISIAAHCQGHLLAA